MPTGDESLNQIHQQNGKDTTVMINIINHEDSDVDEQIPVSYLANPAAQVAEVQSTALSPVQDAQEPVTTDRMDAKS